MGCLDCSSSQSCKTCISLLETDRIGTRSQQRAEMSKAPLDSWIGTVHGKFVHREGITLAWLS